MKSHAQRLSYVKLLALPITSSLLLTACLGGSSEDPFKPGTNPPASTTAASCFDNTLNYTVGNRITMDYTNFAITPVELQPSRAIIQVVRNTASFEGQTNLLLINELRGSLVETATDSWQLEQNNYVARTIPTTGIVTTVGYVSESTSNNAATPTETITTLYNPASQDQRRTLQEGASLTQTLSGTSRVVTSATSSQTATDSTDDFTTTRNITFIGKENLQIGNQRVESCRFRVRVTGQPELTEWVYRGQTIRKDSGGRTTEQVTAFTVGS